jgi:hypothetical protein
VIIGDYYSAVVVVGDVVGDDDVVGDYYSAVVVGSSSDSRADGAIIVVMTLVRLLVFVL